MLRLRASTAGGTGSIPDQETKIPHATRCSQKKKKICYSTPMFIAVLFTTAKMWKQPKCPS